MSYDIRLLDPVTREPIMLESKHAMTGGTFAIGGTQEAWLNVTYNYASWYYRDGVFPEEAEAKGSKGIRTIYGLSGAESIPLLKQAIHALESLDENISEEDRMQYKKQGVDGYWMPTRENAIKPLYQLLALAQMRPDGVWDGD